MPPKGKGKKGKDVVDVFASVATLRNQEPADEVVQEDIRNGEFRDTAVLFAPSQQRGECGMTIRFRCTAKIARGDVVNIRLTGFKGTKGGVFALESRPHPENKSYNHHFQAYYSGDSPPKGIASQTIVLKCRTAVEENALVIVGVPECAHVVLPDKLALNSTKLKIDGQVRHAEGGKIPKAPIMECSEVRKRQIDDDVAELDAIIAEYVGTADEPGILSPEDLEIAQEITLPETDILIMNVHNRRTLPVGMQWKMATSAFHSYEKSCQPIAKTLRDTFRDECRIPLILHKEIARNFEIKLSQVLVLEEALNTMHGSFYPELTRSAIMVLRLYSMETHDLAHLLNLANPPCIHREIHSAMRTQNPEKLKKWVQFIAVLSSCTNKLTHIQPDRLPVLYTGIKDLPAEELNRLAQLQKGSWYVTTDFLSCSTATSDPQIAQIVGLSGASVAASSAVDASINANATITATSASYTIPDNAVLFEIKKVIDGVEMGDCSQYPQDNMWLLPIMSSFTVQSVQTLPDRNNLLKITLEMRGSLGSMLRDERFPEQERTETVTAFFKRAKAIAEATAQKSAAIAKCIHATLRLEERRTHHPQHLMRAKYLEQYAETKRQSQAKQQIEGGLCRWTVCTQEQQSMPDGTTKAAIWETLNIKYSIPVEVCFLKRTRVTQQFQLSEAVSVDFALGVVDYGKGPLAIRRQVGKVTVYPFQAL